MKKYLETSKVLFKAQLAYRFDTFVSIIFTISKILLAYVLWGAIFSTQEMVAGFSFNAMLSYYIISSFVTQLDQSYSTGRQVADEIKHGRFSKYMVKPMSIFGYFTAQTAGVSAFLLSFNLIAAVLWATIFRIDFILTASLSLITSAMFLIVLGLFFMMQLSYFIGILAFKFHDIGVFMMIKDNIVQFITGALIPLALLPSPVVNAMRAFPFYYVSYLPTMLLMGRSIDEAKIGVLVLILWNFIFMLINKLTYKHLITHYEGVGI